MISAYATGQVDIPDKILLCGQVHEYGEDWEHAYVRVESCTEDSPDYACFSQHHLVLSYRHMLTHMDESNAAHISAMKLNMQARLLASFAVVDRGGDYAYTIF